MGVSFRVVTVGVAAVALQSVQSDNRMGQSLAIVPRDGNVTLGADAAVTAGTGPTVGPSGDVPDLAIDLQPGEQVWAVAAAPVAVAVYEGGL